MARPCWRARAGGGQGLDTATGALGRHDTERTGELFCIIATPGAGHAQAAPEAGARTVPCGAQGTPTACGDTLPA